MVAYCTMYSAHAQAGKKHRQPPRSKRVNRFEFYEPLSRTYGKYDNNCFIHWIGLCLHTISMNRRNYHHLTSTNLAEFFVMIWFSYDCFCFIMKIPHYDINHCSFLCGPIYRYGVIQTNNTWDIDSKGFFSLKLFTESFDHIPNFCEHDDL